MRVEKGGEIGEGVFSYVFTNTEDNGGTVWILEFFQDVNFFAITVDPTNPDYLAAVAKRAAPRDRNH